MGVKNRRGVIALERVWKMGEGCLKGATGSASAGLAIGETLAKQVLPDFQTRS